MVLKPVSLYEACELAVGIFPLGKGVLIIHTHSVQYFSCQFSKHFHVNDLVLCAEIKFENQILSYCFLKTGYLSLGFRNSIGIYKAERGNLKHYGSKFWCNQSLLVKHLAFLNSGLLLKVVYSNNSVKVFSVHDHSKGMLNSRKLDSSLKKAA